jgi:hypothetical protein
MNGQRIITSFGSTPLFVTRNTNGLVTMMVMAFEKFTPTLPKVCGRMFETIGALLKAFTQII